MYDTKLISKEFLKNIVENPNIEDEHIEEILLNKIYNIHKENTTTLFLNLQAKDIAEQKKIQENLSQGLNFAKDGFAALNRSFSKSGEDSLFMELSFLLPICKSQYSKGNCKGGSDLDKWLFGKFIEKVKLMKINIENGNENDLNWLKNFDYLDYFNLVCNENNID